MGPFPQAFRQVKECLILELHEMIRVLHAGWYPIAFVLFYGQYWQEGVLKLMESGHIFSIFSHFGYFPQVLCQVKEWLILELHEMIRLLRVVAFPIVFILFYGRNWQEGVFKVMKNDHFFVFLAVWVLFPKFLGRLKGNLC